jgi:uncharacterized protein YecT (DUF1311 family)
MRAFLLGILMLFCLAVPAAADIVDTCYRVCEAETESNPDFKACLSRTANRADRLLNRSYQELQDTIRKRGVDMGEPAEPQLEALTEAQKKWIAFRDENCAFEDSLAFGGTASGGNYSGCLCALTYERINDFDRIREQVLGEE